MTSARLQLKGFSDGEFIEGTEEHRREVLAKRADTNRIAAARRHGAWREYKFDELIPHRHMARTLYETPDGDLLQVCRSNQIFHERRDADSSTVRVNVWNDGAACAFTITDDGGILVLEPGPWRTAIAYKVAVSNNSRKESLHRDRLREKELAEIRLRKEQPLRTVTLADLERRELPTVRAAAAAVLDVFGTLTVRNGCLEIRIPERLATGEVEHLELRAKMVDASIVLLAAGNVVVGALESRSRKDLLERLPDVQVSAGGGLVDD